MRASDPPVQYLVGTPKGRLSRLEKQLLDKPWQQAREGVAVKLLANDGELYVFAQSDDRVAKERAMRRRQLKWLWKRLRELTGMEVSREEMLMKLGAARAKAPTAWRLVDIEMDEESPTFTYALNRKKLRRARRREGRYLLRTNLTENDPTLLWQVLYPARCRGTGIQKPEAGSGDTPRIPSRRAPNRSPHFHRIPRLLSAGHAPASAACPGARADRAQRSGEIRGGPDDRCPPTDNRRAGVAADALHPARARAPPPYRATQAQSAATATPAHRNTSRPQRPQ